MVVDKKIIFVVLACVVITLALLTFLKKKKSQNYQWPDIPTTSILDKQSIILKPIGKKANIISHDPHVYYIHELLTPEEIKHLLELAQNRYNRSHSEQANEKRGVYDARTSYTAFLLRGETPIIKTIEKRIAECAGVSIEKIEPIQVLRYTKGQFFKPHYDYFVRETGEYDPETKKRKDGAATIESLKLGGQRTQSFFVYLNQFVPPKEKRKVGGATIFTELKERILPLKPGDALHWYNVNPATNKEEPLTKHGGEPIYEDGITKHAINIWIRERNYG